MKYRWELTGRQAFKLPSEQYGRNGVPFKKIRQRKCFKAFALRGLMKRGVLTADDDVAVAEEVQLFYQVEQLTLTAAQFFSVVKVKYGEASFHNNYLLRGGKSRMYFTAESVSMQKSIKAVFKPWLPSRNPHLMK